MPDGAQTRDLIRHVYPSFEASPDRDKMFESRLILAPHNKTVDQINAACLDLFPGHTVEYRSFDSIPDDEDAATQHPVEMLNSLDPPGLPQHLLSLKPGMPVMLMRNLDPPLLCNGTRLTVVQLGECVIVARIAVGTHKGEQVFLSRIPLKPSAVDMPVCFRRLQFPIRPCFAVTVHKSQGQSLDYYGLHLGFPCFQHGQLYVGLSRARDPRKVRVLARSGKTKNIVLKGVLADV